MNKTKMSKSEKQPKPFPKLRKTYGSPCLLPQKDLSDLIEDVNKILKWHGEFVAWLQTRNKFYERRLKENEDIEDYIQRDYYEGKIDMINEFLEALKE